MLASCSHGQGLQPRLFHAGSLESGPRDSSEDGGSVLEWRLKERCEMGSEGTLGSCVWQPYLLNYASKVRVAALPSEQQVRLVDTWISWQMAIVVDETL